MENAKLQSALQEMKVQLEETKAMLLTERETIKIAGEQTPLVKEVPVINQEMMGKLTVENENLKVSWQKAHEKSFYEKKNNEPVGYGGRPFGPCLLRLAPFWGQVTTLSCTLKHGPSLIIFVID